MNTNKRWTNEEIETLRNNYYMGAKWLAHELGRTTNAIRCKASSLGIPIESFTPKYSDDEIEYIKANYSNTSIVKIANYLGRSKFALYNKVFRLRETGVM